MKENDQNWLGKMSLIDPKHVEAAAYPETAAQTPLSLGRKWWKAAAAAAAVLAVSLTCAGFYPQLKAAADEFWNSATIFSDGNRVDAQMNVVPINEVSPGDLQEAYDTLDEVENLFGINLLQSPLATKTPVPCVKVWYNFFDGDMMAIESGAYYLHHCTMDPKSTWDSRYYHNDEDDAYFITYHADFIIRDTGGGSIGEYENAQLLEHYTTAHGLDAAITQFGSDYNAVIYHNDICYEFEMQSHGDIDAFKAFLDTLRD